MSDEPKPNANPSRVNLSRRSPRRDFLQGKSALDAIEDLADRLDGPASEGTPDRLGRSEADFVLQFSRPAMACEFEICLNPREHAEGPVAAVEALDLVDRLESQLSVYRDDSEASRINRTAFDRRIPVEPRLFRLLEQAAMISAETFGAFDITTGALSKVWGFYRREGRMPSPDEISAALSGVGFRHLELDDSQRTVRFLHPGCELNLGAIGKGYALDRAAETLRLAATPDFLIHGGNSSVVAGGTRAARDSQRPGWLVGLRHPLRPETRLAEFLLHNQALGTSGSGTQYFHHLGKRYAHIIDPRSGWPADQVLSATAIAPKGALADALSTAFYVLGIEGTRAYCASHPEISALLTIPKAAAGEIELIPVNLGEDHWQPTI